MLRQIAIISFILLNIITMTAQQHPHADIQRIDVEALKEKYPNYKELLTPILDTLANGDCIKYYIYQDKMEDIDEVIYSKDTPYRYHTKYNPKGIVLIKLTWYLDMKVDTGYYYNDRGILIETEDFDAPYPFTIKQLVNKIKTEWDIDLTDLAANKATRIHVGRYIEATYNLPIYSLSYVEDNRNRIAHEAIINGITGETIIEHRAYQPIGVKKYEENIDDKYLEIMQQKDKERPISRRIKEWMQEISTKKKDSIR